jgi:hypothetical protein
MEERQMALRFGVNEADSWWHFASGPHRERILIRLRELNTEIIRIFLGDKDTPDPVSDWKSFESYVNAVLEVGAIPMITFARFHRPFDDPRAVRWFATRCGDVAWNCIERWGEATVSEWLWCVWNEPNNNWIGGGMSFEEYRRVYEEVAVTLLRWLEPCPPNTRPPIGGPSVEGFEPFWLDWVWRFLNEIDESLMGYVNWHCYGDWRDHGEAGAPRERRTHEALLFAQTPTYALRAEAVNRLVGNRGLMNFCGEWNSHSHSWPKVRARFNQTLFGAVYGVSTLLQLVRGGANAERVWTGTDEAWGYGLLDAEGNPKPLYHAKKMVTDHLQRGDGVWFPRKEGHNGQYDVAVAQSPLGRASIILANFSSNRARFEISAGDYEINAHAAKVYKIDAAEPDRVVECDLDGSVEFSGYGVAVITNDASH